MRRCRHLIVAAGTVLGAAACTDDSGGDEEAFCAAATALADDGGLTAELGALDLDDQASANDALRDAATRLRSWAADADGEVADDIEALAVAADALAEAVAGGGPATLAVDARAELETVIADATAASERVVSDVERRCGVRLDDPAPVTPADATTTTSSG